MRYDILEAVVDEMLGRPPLRPAQIVVAENGTVSWDHGGEWHMPTRKTHANPDRKPFPRPRTSSGLLGIMGASNCANANVCYRSALAAVLLAIAVRPFPLGQGDAVYRHCLLEVEDAYLGMADMDLMGVHGCRTPTQHWLEQLDAAFPNIGNLRRALVAKAGSGCNAPTDSYLRIAALVSQGQDLPSDARY